MSLIPERPDLTVESTCEGTGRFQIHKFVTIGDDHGVPVGTVCTCGRTVKTETGYKLMTETGSKLIEQRDPA